ncbi:hypothetical protein GDO86_004603 [Hymenochirus boettgeri]|uniref:Uncharacterized protein n=1 Tax=Hymenochirus boettgeri TaxID=247094 RepID=A0A8T2K8G0_9PIPI|nr:hypothetical protein GDO86_004603 [Hymenochirus boettgeri]
MLLAKHILPLTGMSSLGKGQVHFKDPTVAGVLGYNLGMNINLNLVLLETKFFCYCKLHLGVPSAISLYYLQGTQAAPSINNFPPLPIDLPANVGTQHYITLVCVLKSHLYVE